MPSSFQQDLARGVAMHSACTCAQKEWLCFKNWGLGEGWSPMRMETASDGRVLGLRPNRPPRARRTTSIGERSTMRQAQGWTEATSAPTVGESPSRRHCRGGQQLCETSSAPSQRRLIPKNCIHVHACYTCPCACRQHATWGSARPVPPTHRVVSRRAAHGLTTPRAPPACAKQL